MTEEVVPPAMKKYRVHDGRVTFIVPDEFQVRDREGKSSGLEIKRYLVVVVGGKWVFFIDVKDAFIMVIIELLTGLPYFGQSRERLTLARCRCKNIRSKRPRQIPWW